MSHSSSKQPRVIITYARSLMSLAAARSLSSRGIEVIGCDSVDMTVMHFSKNTSDYFLHEPYDGDVSAYLSSMKGHIKKFKPEDDRPYLLMPMFRDTKILSKHKDAFEGLIEIAAPDFTSIEQISPKDNFARTCKKYDLDAPDTIILEDDTNAEDIDGKIPYPVLLKPIDSVGGRGISKVKNTTELEHKIKQSREKFNSNPLIQELVDGEDYCVAVICDHGQIIDSMAYKNLHTYPKEAGAGVMRETVDASPFIETAQKLMKAINWHGIAEIDFRWSGQTTDRPAMIEVNPRFWMGLFHSIDSGADFPWQLYQLHANGEITDTEEIQIGHKTKIPGIWMLSALHDIAHSDQSMKKLEKSWHNIWKNNDESLKARLSQFSNSFRELLFSEDRKKLLAEKKRIAKDAHSELDFNDDPFFSLGALFVLSSLMRHGKLPPEIKH